MTVVEFLPLLFNIPSLGNRFHLTALVTDEDARFLLGWKAVSSFSLVLRELIEHGHGLFLYLYGI
jgi:hypothetical protein